MKKHPSPLVNPANHCGSGMGKSNTKGLSTGRILGKASFNFDDKHLFIDALIATILFNPSIVICSLLKTKFIASLNKR